MQKSHKTITQPNPTTDYKERTHMKLSDINGVTTGIVTYYCTGTTVDDVFASTVYVI